MADTNVPDPGNSERVQVDVRQPIQAAVVISITAAVVIFTLFLALGGAYLIGVENANAIKANEKTFENAQKVLRTRELESSVRTAIPTCKALIGLDDAKSGASNASSDQNSYGHRLARAITNVVDGTGCRKLISEVNAGVPILKIAQQEIKVANDTK